MGGSAGAGDGDSVHEAETVSLQVGGSAGAGDGDSVHEAETVSLQVGGSAGAGNGDSVHEAETVSPQVGGSAGAGDGDSVHEAETVSLQVGGSAGAGDGDSVHEAKTVSLQVGGSAGAGDGDSVHEAETVSLQVGGSAGAGDGDSVHEAETVSLQVGGSAGAGDGDSVHETKTVSLQVGGSAGAGDGDSVHEAETVSLQEFVATPTASLDDIAVSSADHSDDNSHSVNPGIETTPTINKILPTPDSSDPPSVSEEVSDELDSDRPDLTDSGSAVPSATVEPDSTGWQPGSVGSTVVDDPELDGEEDDAAPLEGRGTEHRQVPSAEGQDGSEDEAVSVDDSGELDTESGRLSAQEVSKSIEETSNSIPEPDGLKGVTEEEKHTAADEVSSAPLSVPASVAGSLGPEDKQDSVEDRGRVAEGAANTVGSVEAGRKGEAAGGTTMETLGNTGQQGGSQETLGDVRQEGPQDGEESLEDVKERLNGGHEEMDDAPTEVEPQLGPSLDASQLEENGIGVPTANGAPATNSGSSEEPEDGSTTRDLATEALEEMSGDKQVFECSSSRAEEDVGGQREEGEVPTPEGDAGGGGSGEGETGNLGEETGSEQREGEDIDHGMEEGSGLKTDSSVPDSTQEQNKQQQQQQQQQLREDGQPLGSGEQEQGSLGEKALLNSESLTNGNGAGVLSGQQKEKSVFLRLSNRIRDLEENMSLFSSYLDQISTRYGPCEEVLYLCIPHLCAVCTMSVQYEEEQEPH